MEEKVKRESTEDILNRNLKKIGYEYEQLIDKDREYLLKVESAITEIFELEQKARELISKNRVTLKGISSTTNIARQTLYNNPILKEYINFRENSFEKIDASLQNKIRIEEIDNLKKEIDELHKRDVELQELKIMNKDLKSQLKEKIKIINRIKSSNTSDNIHYLETN